MRTAYFSITIVFFLLQLSSGYFSFLQCQNPSVEEGKIQPTLLTTLQEYEKRLSLRQRDAFDVFYYNESIISTYESGRGLISLRIIVGADSTIVIGILKEAKSYPIAVTRKDGKLTINCFAPPTVVRSIAKQSTVSEIKSVPYSDKKYTPRKRILYDSIQ